MPNSRIFIVEDEAIVAMNIEERLLSLGYQPAGHAKSGERALQLIQKNQPDLILMDIRLKGGMDGITAAAEVLRRFQIPVIYLTAYSEDETLERAKLTEPYGYILKPFDDRELKSAIEIALYKHRAEKEIRRLNRLYDVLSQINQTVVRVKSRKELLSAVCHIMIERGAIDLAWVGWLDAATSRIIPVASHGQQMEMLNQLPFFADDRPQGQGTPGQAIRTGKTAICNHCVPGHCQEPAKQTPSCFGFQSCGAFPLHFQGQACGVLNIYISQADFFGDREINLFEEVVLDISFALDKLAADARLQESEARLRSIYETAQAGIVVQQADGILTFANQAACEILGMSEAELTSKTSDAPEWQMILEDGTPVPWKEHPSMLTIRTGQPVRNAIRGIFAHDPEKFRWLLANTEPIFDPQSHKLREVTVTFHDVTALKNIQEERRLWSDAFISCAHGIAIGRPGTNTILACNPAFARMHRRPMEELIGVPILSLYAPSDHEQVKKCIAEADGCGQVQYNSVMQRRDGSNFAVQMDVVSVKNEQGKVLYRIATMQDITERKEAEEALRSSEAQYRRLVETANEGIWAMDANYSTTYVNPRMAAMLGYAPAEMLGLVVTDFMFPADLSDHQARMAQRQQGVDDNYERRFRRRDGSELWTIVTTRVLLDEAGTFQGSFAMFTDISERKKTDLALHTERNKLKHLMENIPFGIYIVNANNDIEYINSVLQQEFGPVDGRKCYQYFHDRATACPWCKNAEVFAGRPVRWEWESAKTGKIYDLFDMPLVNEDGSISKLEVFVDITEIKRVTQALQDNEHFLTDIFDSIQDGLCVLDPDLNILRVNPAMARFSEIMSVEGRKCYDIYQSSSDPCEICPVQETFATGQASRRIVTIPSAEGQQEYVEIHAFPLLDRTSGKVEKVIEYVRDVTQRVRMERELQQSELFLKQTQKIARLGGWMANPHTDYLKWTEGVYDIIEAPLDFHLPFSEGIKFFLPEYIPLLKEKIAQCLATGESFSLECQVTTAAGKHLWSEVRGLAPVVEGERSYVIGTFQDITARKEAEDRRQELEAQLSQAQKMEAIGTLAGGIAHDFNNILWAIMGFTELTLKSMPEGSKDRQRLQQVLRASERAKDLINQILAFSRKSNQEKTPLQVALIVKEALKLLRATVPTTIEIKQEISSPKAWVLADPTQIHQIIMNLGTNAVQAMREKGDTLAISLDEKYLDRHDLIEYPDLTPGSYVVLTVTDNGPGIAPEIIDKIFDPFFTTKGLGEGTGMGLAVVYGIVKSHGGGITVKSPLQAGSVFTVLLPKAFTADIQDIEVPAPIPHGHGHLLVVDDEIILVELLRDMLDSLEYEVTISNSSLEALRIFQAQPDIFSLVITDQTMPQMDGMRLSKEFRQLRPDIPIILCTGFSEKISEEIVKAAGINALLMKPINLTDLGETVKKVLDKENQ